MKRIILSAFILGALTIPSAAFSDDYTLGNVNFGAKIDYVKFSEDFLETNDIDGGVLVGLTAYTAMGPNIYVGAELGYMNPSGHNAGVGTKLTYVPVELNFKYADEAAPDITFAIGGGMSLNYAEETTNRSGSQSTKDDWMLGAQAFGEITYTSGNFYAGVNLKYQFTENFVEAAPGGGSYGYTNWRFGGQAGFMF